MSSSSNKYKGIRRRKWGKWVSEIRVPGTSDRLWLGSYTTPEAAAVAHDVASYCLRGDGRSLNFPLMAMPPSARLGMSPRSLQQIASDAGLAVDARLPFHSYNNNQNKQQQQEDESSRGTTTTTTTTTTTASDDHHSPADHIQGYLNISVDDYDFH